MWDPLCYTFKGSAFFAVVTNVLFTVTKVAFEPSEAVFFNPIIFFFFNQNTMVNSVKCFRKVNKDNVKWFFFKTVI